MMMRFGSSTMIAGAMASAIGFYTLSLHVSAERGEADKLRGRIAADLKDIRALEAELRTRARLPVLQKWNDEVLALSAPTSKQFADTVQLASFAPNAPVAMPGEPAVQLAIATPEAAALPVPGVIKASYQAPAVQIASYVPAAVVDTQPQSPSSRRKPGPRATDELGPGFRRDDALKMAKSETDAAKNETKPAQVEVKIAEAEPKPAAPVKLAEAKPKLPAKIAPKPALGDLDALTSAIDNAVATERGGFRKVAMQ